MSTKKKSASQISADNAFMAKLKTLNFVTKSSSQNELSALAKKYGVPEVVPHPESGGEMKLVAAKEAPCGCALGLFQIKHKRTHDGSGEESLAA